MNMTNCPNCKGKLKIREYHCDACKLTLRGEFDESYFANLTKDQLEFIRIFILSQGNIKLVEKHLNISYPTVKNRLSDIIKVIGKSDNINIDYTDVFNDLEEGFVNVEEALAMIEARRKNK